MSLNEPCYDEFSPWLREAFSKADFDDLRDGYLELEPSQQHSRIDSIINDQSFSCEQRLSILRDSFYELYLNHSQASQDDSYTFRGNLRAYQKLWRCARCSPDMMNLLFFRRINA